MKKVKCLAKNPNFLKNWIVITKQIIRDLMKKVTVTHQRKSLQKNLTETLIPTSHIKKTLILRGLFVIKVINIGNYLKEPKKTERDLEVRFLEDRNTNFKNELKYMSWSKVRPITKAMWRKHKKDKTNKELDKYKNFVKVSTKLWKVEFTKYLKF